MGLSRQKAATDPRDGGRPLAQLAWLCRQGSNVRLHTWRTPRGMCPLLPWRHQHSTHPLKPWSSLPNPPVAKADPKFGSFLISAAKLCLPNTSFLSWSPPSPTPSSSLAPQQEGVSRGINDWQQVVRCHGAAIPTSPCTESYHHHKVHS